jgi:hypothetical protein
VPCTDDLLDEDRHVLVVVDEVVTAAVAQGVGRERRRIDLGHGGEESLEAIRARALVPQEYARVHTREGGAEAVFEERRAAHDQGMAARLLQHRVELRHELGRELRVLEDLPDERELVPDLLGRLVLLALVLIQPVEADEALDHVRAHEPRFGQAHLGDGFVVVLFPLALQDAVAEEHAGGFTADAPLAFRWAEHPVHDPLEVGDAKIVLRDADELELIADEVPDERHPQLRGAGGGQPLIAARQPAEMAERLRQHVERHVGQRRDALEALRLVPAPHAVDDGLHALGGQPRRGVTEHRLPHRDALVGAPGRGPGAVGVVVGRLGGRTPRIRTRLFEDVGDRGHAFAVQDDQELPRDAVGELGPGGERLAELRFGRVRRPSRGAHRPFASCGVSTPCRLAASTSAASCGCAGAKRAAAFSAATASTGRPMSRRIAARLI